MQCVNCNFFNMPGLAVCGRCGSSLTLGDDLDVHPPRASARTRKLRGVLACPFGRAWFGLRHGLWRGSVAVGRQFGSDLAIDVPNRGLILRTIVPGWAHVAAGLVIRGRIFWWSYLTLALTGLFFFGTTLGSVLMGLAFSVHVSSVIDLLSQRGTLRQRIEIAILALFGVGLLIYAPLGWLVSRVVSARVLNYDMGIFRRGDVVLINRLDRPDPGQAVLFWMNREERAAGTDPFWQHAMYYLPEGERVGRVVAGPGQTVEWDGEELRVDGQLLDITRFGLNPRLLPHENPFLVPAGVYLVQPAGVPDLDARLHSELWRSFSLAREEHVQGTICMIYQPLGRRRWVR